MSDLCVKFPEPCAEKWEEMAPSGCNRFCAACDKTIHDLSHYTIDEAEALLASKGKICVRAQMDRNGAVKLKASLNGGTRRVMAKIGVSLGLVALSGHAIAGKTGAEGSITGTVQVLGPGETTVVAIDTKGKKYKAKVRDDDTFEIRKLPPGTYRLSFSVRCYSPRGWRKIRYSWDGETVAVRENATTKSDANNEEEDWGGCPIYVGMIEADTVQG